MCTPLTSYYEQNYPTNMDQWFPLCINWLNTLFDF